MNETSLDARTVLALGWEAPLPWAQLEPGGQRTSTGELSMRNEMFSIHTWGSPVTL